MVIHLHKHVLFVVLKNVSTVQSDAIIKTYNYE